MEEDQDRREMEEYLDRREMEGDLDRREMEVDLDRREMEEDLDRREMEEDLDRREMETSNSWTQDRQEGQIVRCTEDIRKWKTRSRKLECISSIQRETSSD